MQELFLRIRYFERGLSKTFESGKCGKEEEKLQTFEYLENEKSFLDEIKDIFHSF